MLIGTYTSKIGAKKRISFPKKFRNELGEKLIITRGYENCLIAVDESRWQEITKDIVGGSFLDKNIRDSSRFLVAGAYEVDLDSQGRFVVPEDLFEFAEVDESDEEIVFLGLVNWVEIWSKNVWAKRDEFIRANSDKIVQELADKTNSK